MWSPCAVGSVPRYIFRGWKSCQPLSLIYLFGLVSPQCSFLACSAMSRSVNFHLKPQRESQSCTLLAKPTTYKARFALTFSFVANPAMPVIFSMTNPFTGGAVVASIFYFSSCSLAWSARAFISLRRWLMQLLRIEQVEIVAAVRSG